MSKRKKTQDRVYFCRVCKKERVGKTVPIGWYSVNRHRGEAWPLRLGVYCSLEHLEECLDEFYEFEESMGDDWIDHTDL